MFFHVVSYKCYEEKQGKSIEYNNGIGGLFMGVRKLSRQEHTKQKGLSCWS